MFSPQTVFSLNFSSAGTGSSWPVRQKYVPEVQLPGGLVVGGGGGGSGVRDMALFLLGNLRAKFSETLPPFKTYFTQIAHCHLQTTI